MSLLSRTLDSPPLHPPPLLAASRAAGVTILRSLSLGMACLALVRLARSETLAVLKTLDAPFCEEEELLWMLEDEIRLLRSLRHPRIIPFLGGDETGDPPYLLVALVSGPDLQTFCRDRPSLPVPLALEIAIQILEGLTYLHNACAPSGEALRIVYRDLKPANVLLEKNGQIRLIDFGLSVFSGMARQTQTTSLRGTWAYLSPEAIHGLPLAPSADLFSWAALVSELLLGRSLFSSRNPDILAQEICDPSITFPEAVLLPSWDALFRLLRVSLARSPHERLPASTLLSSLLALQEHLGFDRGTMQHQLAALLSPFSSAFGESSLAMDRSAR